MVPNNPNFENNVSLQMWEIYGFGGNMEINIHQILVSQSRRQVFPCTYNREYERSVRSGELAEKKRLYFFQKILV